MPFDMEQQFEALQKSIGDLTDKVQQTAENALKEAKNSGELSAETKAKVDEMLTKQGGLTEKMAQLEEKLEQNSSDILDIQQCDAKGVRGGSGDGRQTLGEAVVQHDDTKTWAEKGDPKQRLNISVTNVITTDGASAGEMVRPHRGEDVDLPMQETPIRALIPAIPISTGNVEYLRQNLRDNQAAPTAETAMKPESNYTWTLENAAVQTIAHWVHVSKQAMDDLPMLKGKIDTELSYGLDLVENAQLLSGDGVAPNLSGLITNSTVYSGAAEAKITSGGGATIIDKLRVAMLEATLNLYPADGTILSHEDWMVIETWKTSDGAYLFANPAGIAGPVLWGRRVVPTHAMTIDKFLVGAFRMAATIYDRQGTQIDISDEDRDNFVKNMLTVRAEKRLVLEVKRPASLIYGDFGLVA